MAESTESEVEERRDELSDIGRRGASLMWRYARWHPAPLVASIAGAAGFSVMLVLTTVLMGWITDEVILPAFTEDGIEDGRLTVALGLIGLIAIARAATAVIRRYFGYMTAGRSRRTIRGDLAEAYLGVPLAYHRRATAGRLLAHADADTVAATDPLMAFPFTVGVMVLVGVALVSLAVIDPFVTAVALVLFPLLAVVSQMYTRRVEGPQTRVQARIGSMSARAHESFDGALIVKLLGLEDHERQRFRREIDALRSERLIVGRLGSNLEPTIDAIPNVGVVALLAIGAWRVSGGHMSEGEVVQAMYLFNILAFPVRVVGFFLQSIPRGVLGIDRIDEVLAEPHDIQGPAPSRPVLPDGPLAVAFDEVSFAYTDESTLDQVSFAVEAGERVALVGPTGSGKSTVLGVLSRLEHVAAGTVRVGGVELEAIPDAELRRRLVLVPQEAFLFGSTIGENLDLLGTADVETTRSAALAAAAHEFIDDLSDGYDTVVGERGVTLSGGQRQRVALARGLAVGPSVLLLDDATSAVDPTVEARILDNLADGAPMTVIVVAHRLSTIALADRVIHFDGGRVVDMGTHAQLLERDPDYAALVSSYQAAEGPEVSP